MGLNSSDFANLEQKMRQGKMSSFFYSSREQEHDVVVKRLSSLSVYATESAATETRGVKGQESSSSFGDAKEEETTFRNVFSGKASRKGQSTANVEPMICFSTDSQLWLNQSEFCTSEGRGFNSAHAAYMRLAAGSSPVAEVSSSSFSFSGSFNDNSGVVSSQQSDESDAESALDSYAGLCQASKGSFLRRKSLSAHFSGKSKSFTSLADVEKVKSIQELAKPERFCRLKARQHCLKRMNVAKSISKSCQKSRKTLSRISTMKVVSGLSGLGPLAEMSAEREAMNKEFSAKNVRSMSMLDLCAPCGSLGSPERSAEQ